MLHRRSGSNGQLNASLQCDLPRRAAGVDGSAKSADAA
jgi:hypothetical protein